MIPPALREAARRALALDDDRLLGECEVTRFIGPGPGGQHRNKTESAVRLHHPFTGVTVTATERRSQHQNLGAAVERLRAQLTTLTHVPKRRRATRPTRGAVQRRLEAKRRLKSKKADRRDGW
jgi:protein subunit release factor B